MIASSCPGPRSAQAACPTRKTDSATLVATAPQQYYITTLKGKAFAMSHSFRPCYWDQVAAKMAGAHPNLSAIAEVLFSPANGVQEDLSRTLAYFLRSKGERPHPLKVEPIVAEALEDFVIKGHSRLLLMRNDRVKLSSALPRYLGTCVKRAAIDAHRKEHGRRPAKRRRTPVKRKRRRR